MVLGLLILDFCFSIQNSSPCMTSNRFIHIILAAFIFGNMVIVLAHYNSANNIHNLITGNEKLLTELNAGNQLRELEQRRPLANEANNTSRRSYDSGQRLLNALSASTNSSGRKAQRWSAVLILLVLVSGAVLFWNIISRIRQQNQLIRQLDASEKKLRDISLLKQNFMANISHEIRTPLNAILGFTNLLGKRNRDLELTEMVDAIGKSGENLLVLINDLLDLSKIEAGMMRIESAPFNVRNIVRTVQTMFREKMTEKGLHFFVVIDDSIPNTLSGDPTRLTQILVNLIGNAVKFTQAGSIRLEVNNKGFEGHQIRLGFVIRDTGIGIASEQLPAIFDRFRQAGDSITRTYGGTGLGLAIVKDLVLLQNGAIAVESEPGKGTVFSLTIPYQIAVALATQQGAPAGPDSRVGLVFPGKAGFESPGSRTIQVMVVEDNKLNQVLLRHLLTAWNLSFDIVSHGIKAIEKLQTGRYDLVLMDIQMPGMDGFTTTQVIRTKLKLDTPVIAMTAQAFAGEREKSLNRGMNEYIAKPIDEGELYRLIAKFTGIKANRPETKKDMNNKNRPVINLSTLPED
jgi:signal transduction histidine kinase/FixJ family two-component response regulator